MKLVNGQDYQSLAKRKQIETLAQDFIKHHRYAKDKPLSTRFFNTLLNYDVLKPGYGYTQGVEVGGELQCLIVGELIENLWINQVDGLVLGILAKQNCNPKYTNKLIELFEKWCRDRACDNIYIFSWNTRKGYTRIFERWGFEATGYTYMRKINDS